MKRIDIVLLTLTVIMAAMLIGLYVPMLPVQAAPPADPDVYICPQVAQANGIEVYRCLDEQTGAVLYVNQLGFMSPGEQ